MCECVGTGSCTVVGWLRQGMVLSRELSGIECLSGIPAISSSGCAGCCGAHASVQACQDHPWSCQWAELVPGAAGGSAEVLPGAATVDKLHLQGICWGSSAWQTVQLQQHQSTLFVQASLTAAHCIAASTCFVRSRRARCVRPHAWAWPSSLPIVHQIGERRER
jgi:hypothetical protein